MSKFWPHWMLESSKHAPSWQASEEHWSPPALPVCLAGCRPRGQGTGMDGPVAGSLLPRWLALSAGSLPGGVAPWRQAMIGYANFHLLPPNTCGLRGEMTGWWYWSMAECVCTFLYLYLFESQFKLNTCSGRTFIGLFLNFDLALGVGNTISLQDPFSSYSEAFLLYHTSIFLSKWSLLSCYEIVDVQISISLSTLQLL